ncbi:Homeodomain-like DNA binding domain-containing transcription factor, partial [Phycomyces blakesleeanus NRRL 1555(-)]
RKRRGNLPKNIIAILKQWLTDHCNHPYPTEEEKVELRTRTNLTLNQISNWFINARRRH